MPHLKFAGNGENGPQISQTLPVQGPPWLTIKDAAYCELLRHIFGKTSCLTGESFGGVHDVEESDEGIDSEFFDTLFAWNIERNRFFPLTLRRPRNVSKKQQTTDRGNIKRGRGKADEEELLRNLAALETTGSIANTDAMDIDVAENKDEDSVKAVQPVLMTMPHARFNAQLAVQDDTLYIFGGTYEHGDREYTFDEMYAVDLGKLDGIKEIFRKELENWHGSDCEDTDSEEEVEYSEDEDMDGESSSGVILPKDESLGALSHPESNSEETGTSTIEEEQQESAIRDTRPHPRPFESLRDFFARTSNAWQELVLEPREADDGSHDSVKELRKKAFEVAEAKWWDSREEITVLEDQQEEAGIGEVVSMVDRGSDQIGGMRRR